MTEIDCREAPNSGMMLAIYIDQVVYKKYDKKKEELTFGNGLLELHLFDKVRELRFVYSRMKRGYIKALMDDTLIGEETERYEETVFVIENDADKQDGPRQKVVLVNYITYDEKDFLLINNYRLKVVNENG